MATHLPDELLLKIAKKLPTVKDLVAFGAVNKQYHSVMVEVIKNLIRATGNRSALYKNHDIKWYIKYLHSIEQRYADEFPRGRARSLLGKYKKLTEPKPVYTQFLDKLRDGLTDMDFIITWNFDPNRPGNIMRASNLGYDQRIGETIGIRQILAHTRAHNMPFLASASLIWGLMSTNDRQRFIDM